MRMRMVALSCVAFALGVLAGVTSEKNRIANDHPLSEQRNPRFMWPAQPSQQPDALIFQMSPASQRLIEWTDAREKIRESAPVHILAGELDAARARALIPEHRYLYFQVDRFGPADGEWRDVMCFNDGVCEERKYEE